GGGGLVAGAMTMATGEYVSVSSQSDHERADLARERIELRDNVEFEKEELAQIYVMLRVAVNTSHPIPQSPLFAVYISLDRRHVRFVPKADISQCNRHVPFLGQVVSAIFRLTATQVLGGRRRP